MPNRPEGCGVWPSRSWHLPGPVRWEDELCPDNRAHSVTDYIVSDIIANSTADTVANHRSTDYFAYKNAN